MDATTKIIKFSDDGVTISISDYLRLQNRLYTLELQMKRYEKMVNSAIHKLQSVGVDYGD